MRHVSPAESGFYRRPHRRLGLRRHGRGASWSARRRRPPTTPAGRRSSSSPSRPAPPSFRCARSQGSSRAARFPRRASSTAREWVRAATESMRVMTGGEPTVRRSRRRSAGASPARRPARCWRSSRRASSGQYDPFARQTAVSCCWCTRTSSPSSASCGWRPPTSGCGCACTRSPTGCSSGPIRGWPTTCRSALAVLTHDAGQDVDAGRRPARRVSSGACATARTTMTRNRIRPASSGCCGPCSPSRSARRSTGCWCWAPCWRATPTT